MFAGDSAGMENEFEPPESVRRIERARLAKGVSVRRAAKVAGLSEGRWRQIAKGYQQVTKGVRAPVSAPVDTLARMALAVGLEPQQFDGELAEAMRAVGPVPPADDTPVSERLEWFEFAHSTSRLASDTVLHLERGDEAAALESAREVALRLALIAVGAGLMRPTEGFGATLERLRAGATRLEFERFNDAEEGDDHEHTAPTTEAGSPRLHETSSLGEVLREPVTPEPRASDPPGTQAPDDPDLS